ncbi:MAG: carboxypeptidase M32 [Solobacterium sp.]|nr:carboxypeptidase M32 [Solobacterium sp.]
MTGETIMKEELLKEFDEWVLKLSAYQMALSLIGVDKQTLAPQGGAAYRDERTAYLAGEMFSIETDLHMVEVRRQLLAEDIDADKRREIELMDKEIEHILVVPKEMFVSYTKLTAEAYEVWHRAKNAEDYTIFEPVLKKVIEASKQMYACRNSDAAMYDQMLDDYEPGMTMEKYDAFFDRVRERLVPLIRKVTEAQQIDDSFLKQPYDVQKQKEYMNRVILPYLGFDSSWGYQNETEHPFTDIICENDIRVTTKYLENNVVSAILSTVHEVGHGYYGHDVAPEYDGTIFNYGISSGMHESQSRLLENYLGRTLPFWEANYPALQETFPEQLKDVTVEQFVRAINVGKPSLVRTEADELTYPLHILIRYEIEKGLFTGTIPTENLDRTWDETYEKYLGVKAPTAKLGILQDVHWSNGSFGYFPTYALGSAFSAQFMKAMRRDIDVDGLLRNGRFSEIIDWLKEHIHRYGCRYNADEIMRMVTGEPFNPDYYLDYLEEKYTKLYHL